MLEVSSDENRNSHLILSRDWFPTPPPNMVFSVFPQKPRHYHGKPASCAYTG